MFIAPVAWPVALIIAAGSITGGQLGALIGRRLPLLALRLVIMLIGSLAAVRMLIG